MLKCPTVLALNLNPNAVRRVTALYLGRVGDLVVSTPMLRSLKLGFPRAALRLVTSSPCRDAAALIPFPDETLLAYRVRHPLKNLRLARSLREPCDLLVDLNPSFSRSAAALVALAAAPVKLSFEKQRLRRLYTHRVDAPGEREHMLDRFARLAEALGTPYEPRMELKTTEQDERNAERILNENLETGTGPRVLIHPGNFKKYDNRWPEEKFGQLTERILKNTNAQAVFLAGPGEEIQVRKIISGIPQSIRPKAPLLPSAPLGVTAALIRRVDLCALNITGTTHVAAAVGTPTFGFYSGYTDAVWRPRDPRHSGCVSDQWESCRSITVEAAWDGLLKALSGFANFKAKY